MPDPRTQESLVDRLEGRHTTVVVVGLGYVGLPLACAFAEVGHRVVGIDLDERKVQSVRAGSSHIEDVPPSQVKRLVHEGRLWATSEYDAARDADAAIIAVPTPIDEYRVPDLKYVQSAAMNLAAVMRPGSLVVLESTTYPGTTEEIVLSAFRNRGFEAGTNIFIGYSPERIDPGNRDWSITDTPKVISGLTKACLEVTKALYSSVVKTLVPVSNVRTAEITKLFENIFRGVNIALVNEFQIICDEFDIDVWEVIQACSTKPYGFMTFYPGPGLGGHCVPVDPFYLAWKARQLNVTTEFIELSGRVNARMPNYVVRKAIRLLSKHHKAINGSRVGLIGVAYKRNTADVRESPAIKIIELLLREGAVVSYHDPHVPSLKINGHEFRSHEALSDFLDGQDAVIVTTDHASVDWPLVLQHSPKVIDTRNALVRVSGEGAGIRRLELQLE